MPNEQIYNYTLEQLLKSRKDIKYKFANSFHLSHTPSDISQIVGNRIFVNFDCGLDNYDLEKINFMPTKASKGLKDFLNIFYNRCIELYYSTNPSYEFICPDKLLATLPITTHNLQRYLNYRLKASVKIHDRGCWLPTSGARLGKTDLGISKMALGGRGFTSQYGLVIDIQTTSKHVYRSINEANQVLQTVKTYLKKPIQINIACRVETSGLGLGSKLNYLAGLGRVDRLHNSFML